ncbi:hypothetical protein HZA55_01830 [Candidatus Poribacteria bacterium]|nr:hypothetical protein [Candidatus Poribacteria bacterium]
MQEALKKNKEDKEMFDERILGIGSVYAGKSLTELGEMLGIKRAAASIAMYRGKNLVKKVGVAWGILNILNNVP